MNWKFWQRNNANQESEVMEAAEESASTNLFKLSIASLIAISVILYLIGMYWSSEPEPFEVVEAAAFQSTNDDKRLVVGYTTVLTTEKIAKTLLSKPGGFMSNDVLPPSVMLDNIPSWEFGVLVQVRDMASVLRNHMSRSQSQSLENEFLKDAEPLFNNDHSQWIWPAAESKYQSGIKKLEAYREKLKSQNSPENQFYARADNLKRFVEALSSAASITSDS